ncbi:MAG: ABC transporter substrate-binding protein [Candidatus Bathyarchaeia archaeon]
MSKKFLLTMGAIVVIVFGLIAWHLLFNVEPYGSEEVRLAVEFTDHAACAFIAKQKGFFKGNGLNVTAFDCYITGTALAAALSREDIDAAYICLIPAICTYANAKVPIKIVAGAHEYGYALVVNQNKVRTVKDLENPDVVIACMQKGTSTEVLLRKMIERYGLNEDSILSRVRYMNPPLALLSLEMGQIDAAFLPEQYPTMAEELGFKVLLTAQNVWPNMLGSVLVVKESLIKNRPDVVEKLVKATIQGTRYIYDNPSDAAQIVAEELKIAGKQVLPSDVADIAAKLEITPRIISKSLSTRVMCTNNVNLTTVQEVIDYVARLGYIECFKAEEILDLNFLEGLT